MYDNRQTAISCKNSIPTTLSANFIEVPFMYESLNDRILPDFFKSMEDLLLKEREEIPSFTRIYQKEKLICETFNEVEKKFGFFLSQRDSLHP